MRGGLIGLVPGTIIGITDCRLIRRFAESKGKPQSIYILDAINTVFLITTACLGYVLGMLVIGE